MLGDEDLEGVLLSIDNFIESCQKADIDFENCTMDIVVKYAKRGNSKAQNILGDKYFEGVLQLPTI